MVRGPAADRGGVGARRTRRPERFALPLGRHEPRSHVFAAAPRWRDPGQLAGAHRSLGRVSRVVQRLVRRELLPGLTGAEPARTPGRNAASEPRRRLAPRRPVEPRRPPLVPAASPTLLRLRRAARSGRRLTTRLVRPRGDAAREGRLAP